MEALDLAIAKSPKEFSELQALHAKSKKLVNFLMGQTLKANPTFDPVEVRRILEERILNYAPTH